MDIKKSIKSISDNALCTACGACCSVCPSKAITMTTNVSGYLLATINEEKCIHCGMCYEVCPSTIQSPSYIDGIDIFHGDSLCGYIGYANDKGIRQNSQSGGIITALLCYLLDKELIDGAIVNTFNKMTQRPQAVYATTREGIIEGCGSYYTQSSVVKTILENNKGKKTAAVTLGCQAESLRLIREKFSNIELPEYTIGLVCAGQNSGYIVDDLISQSGCDNKNQVTGFRFRDKNIGGWPGNVAVSIDKKTYMLDKKKRLHLKPVYELYRCILCFDQMNTFSDIVVGDPWGIINKDKREGYSAVIARTEKGKKLLEDAMRDGFINLEMIPVETIIKGQTVDSRHKTKFFTARNISIGKGWLFPYNEMCFEDIEYQKVDKKTLARLMKRMEYARKLYCVNDKEVFGSLVQGKKAMINRKEILSYPIAFLRRCVGYIMKKTHLKRSK